MGKQEWGKMGWEAPYPIILPGRNVFPANVACNAQGTENMEVAGGYADI